jgi:Xaa-Pro aminopeptidase
MNRYQKNRVDNLRAEAAKHDLDWVLCMLPENIFYFSGFRSTFYTAFIGTLVPSDPAKEPVLIGMFIDRQLIEQDIWSKTWFEKTAIWGPGCEYANHWEALSAYLRPGTRLGVDAVTLGFYQELLKNFPGMEIKNITDEILALRTVKDAQEITTIKKAFNLAEDVMDKVAAWLQEPMTEAELAARLNYTALKAGAEAIFYPTLVSCGDKITALHSPPTSRPIKEKELLRVAFGLQIDGYGSDIVRHFCIGKPPAEMEPLRKAFFEVHDLIPGRIKPGVDTVDLYNFVRHEYTKRGVAEYWIGNFGHGLALTIHEFPRVSGALHATLQENMVLAYEPILARHPFGAMAHCDGVVVTKDGCEMLSGRIKDVVIV